MCPPQVCLPVFLPCINRIAYERIAYERIAYERIAYERIAYERIAYERIACNTMFPPMYTCFSPMYVIGETYGGLYIYLHILQYVLQYAVSQWSYAIPSMVLYTIIGSLWRYCIRSICWLRTIIVHCVYIYIYVYIYVYIYTQWAKNCLQYHTQWANDCMQYHRWYCIRSLAHCYRMIVRNHYGVYNDRTSVCFTHTHTHTPTHTHTHTLYMFSPPPIASPWSYTNTHICVCVVCMCSCVRKYQCVCECVSVYMCVYFWVWGVKNLWVSMSLCIVGPQILVYCGFTQWVSVFVNVFVGSMCESRWL